MKGSDYMTKTIHAYLEQRAENDELFAVTYRKPNKNIEDCVTYIINTVKATGCNGFTDDEIFSMAVHYYDEDDIKVGNKINCKVVVNRHIELTAEEKEKARQDAIQRASTEQYNKMKSIGKDKGKGKKVTLNSQQTLF